MESLAKKQAKFLYFFHCGIEINETYVWVPNKWITFDGMKFDPMSLAQRLLFGNCFVARSAIYAEQELLVEMDNQ